MRLTLCLSIALGILLSSCRTYGEVAKVRTAKHLKWISKDDMIVHGLYKTTVPTTPIDRIYSVNSQIGMPQGFGTGSFKVPLPTKTVYLLEFSKRGYDKRFTMALNQNLRPIWKDVP